MAVSAQQCALISPQLLSHALCLVKAIIFLLIKPNVLNYQKPSCTLIIFMCHGEVEQKKFLNDKFPFPGQNFEEKLIPHHGNTTLDKKFNAKLPGEKGRGGGAEGREGGLARLTKIE